MVIIFLYEYTVTNIRDLSLSAERRKELIEIFVWVWANKFF